MAGPNPTRVRERITDVNDGILAVAGFSEGLIGSGLAGQEIYAIIAISAVAGAFSVAAARLGEVSAARDAEQELIADERRRLDLSPQEEIAELVDYYRAKGVSEPTARQVAVELTEADALSAQLDAEYGIRELTQPGDSTREAIWAGLSFLIGAALPVLVAYFYPGPWLDEFTLIAVVGSLVVTGVVLSRLDHTRILRTLLRSVLIGLATLGASYLVGLLLT